MSEESNKQDEPDSGPTGGEKLRAARRANDISLRDVAKELHIDEPKVRALEKNQFDLLGAPVFAKGHLRKYAEMVGVPVDDIMSDYYQLTRSTGGSGSPPLVGRISKPGRDINLAPWIVALLLLLVSAGALYWWFEIRDEPAVAPAAGNGLAPFSEPQDRNETSPEPLAEAPQPAVVENAVFERDDAPEPQTETEAPPQAAASITPSPVSEPAVAPAQSDASNVSVVLRFSGDCWTEVSDATGRQLFYDLAAAGRALNLSGEAPLRVILGDAANVSVTVEGEAWTIPASARRGRLARFTINAP